MLNITLSRFFQIMICCLFAIPFSQAQDWYLAKDKAGVKVYTRKKAGWDIKEFKGIVYINSTLEAVEAALRDDKNRSKWMHNTHETEDVKVVSKDLLYAYSRVATPWPVADRDNVTEYRFKRVSDKELYVYFKNVEGIVAEKSGIIRIKKMQGFWHFKDVGNGKIKVTQQAVAEAGGSIPAWLANSGVIDSPYYTLYEMKKYVEKRYPVHPVRD
jgi:hypothetical protein